MNELRSLKILPRYNMPWPTPKFSRTQVAKAGSFLAQFESEPMGEAPINLHLLIDSYDVIANWRACHGYPINTFQATLRNRLKRVDPGALVAQRMKRTPSIINKLRRFKGMSLARMQDIGGLRAVVRDIPRLRKLGDVYEKTPLTHELVAKYDYVEVPKPSGYRSIHFVYRYKARQPSPYDGLLLELQLRTKVQHSWATAVETAGTFLEHSLKSSDGPEEWLEFFAVAGGAFAHLERCNPIPEFADWGVEETYRRTLAEAERLHVKQTLIGYSSAVREIAPGTKRAAFYLVHLDLKQEEKTVSVTPFARDQLEQANVAYAELEKSVSLHGDSQVVLVSAGSIESLKRAYPNYFLDTHEFLKNLDRVEREAGLIAATDRRPSKSTG